MPSAVNSKYVRGSSPRAASTRAKARPRSSSSASSPLSRARSVKRSRCGDVCSAVLSPAARAADSMKVQVEPFPFVPPTVTTGASK